MTISPSICYRHAAHLYMTSHVCYASHETSQEKTSNWNSSLSIINYK